MRNYEEIRESYQAEIMIIEDNKKIRKGIEELLHSIKSLQEELDREGLV